MEPLLKCQRVQVAYGLAKIIHGVEFSVLPGEFVALLGPNGAGKTTLLKALVGLLHPHGGEVWFNGHRVTRANPDDMLRQGMALVPEGRWIFQRLTVFENLKMGAFLFPSRLAERLEVVLEVFQPLKNRLSVYGGALSGGEQQMLAIARALMSQPTLMLLDEPSLGVAPVMRDVIYAKLAELNKEDRMTVVVVEQYPEWVQRYADRILVLNHGQLVVDRSGDAIGEEELIQAYLT